MELDHICSSTLIHFGKIIHVFEIYFKYSTTLAFLFLNYDGFEKILLQYREQEKPYIISYGIIPWFNKIVPTTKFTVRQFILVSNPVLEIYMATLAQQFQCNGEDLTSSFFTALLQ